MGYRDIADPNSVLAAIRECDLIGQDQFLTKYGFEPAEQYFLSIAGRLYDSKAIVGAAHGYEFPEQGPLRSTEFSGGDRTVRELLNRLGFDVLVKAPNPFKLHDDETLAPTSDYSLTDCASDISLSPKKIDRWISAIKRKGQAIFYGPPGTGKTYIAEHLAKYFTSGSQGITELVQFHPAYGYEDFVFGIRPGTDSRDALIYKEQDGRFISFCERARHLDGISVFIIDEINRANLSETFGELLYLLEYRDRSVTLAGGRVFSLPKNVIIIGTMNTADRSIALMDYALRRRFAFLRLDPQYDLLDRYLTQRELKAQPLISLLAEVNEAIADPNYALGVSFFLRDDLRLSIEEIWRVEIEPYLEEYFFDRPDQVDRFSWDQIANRLAL